LLILLAQLKGVSRINQLLQDIFASKEYYNIVFFAKELCKRGLYLGKEPYKRNMYFAASGYICIFSVYIYIFLSRVLSFVASFSLSFSLTS